jgi:V8-like Glu-specific endopeptidase
MRRALTSAAAGLVLLAATPSLAAEGMWTLDNFPSEQVRRELGVTIGQAWLDKVRGSAARIPGCSASFVSGQGLMLTNYHCISSCAQNLSTAETDYLKTGFLPKSTAEEKRCPGSFAEVLLSIGDVTERVKAAGEGKTGGTLVQATGAEQAAIEKEACGDRPDVRCQVVSLYGGAQYKLYRFKRYDDVRLAFAPEFKTGFFGGDPDNFNFPRYNLDAAFLRAYENGKPAVTPEHFAWNPGPLRAGQPVFVVGNPGSTQRLLTQAQLSTLRDFTLPFQLVLLSEKRGRLIRFGQESAENARIAQDAIIGLENGFKVQYGRHRALTDPAFWAELQAREAELRTKAGAAAGDPWSALAGVQDDYRELYLPYYFLEASAGDSSRLYNWAQTLVRAARERARPAAERAPEFADARIPLIERSLLSDTPVRGPLEELYLTFWLSKAREHLGADSDAAKALLGTDSPEAKAAALAADSKLGDLNVRRALWEGGLAAVETSDDPMIRLALAVDPLGRAAKSAWETRVQGPTTQAQRQVADARFAAYGADAYPDATFTTRVTYGAIEGWTERGERVPEFTTFEGLFARATGQPPYDLPQSWYAAKERLNLQTQFNHAATLDIIGGNSGSPTLNAEAEVVGTVFDGNIHSLGGAYGYDPRLNRSVHVTAAAIQEALTKVYGMDRLVRELNASAPQPKRARKR